MADHLRSVKTGLALVLLGLCLNVGLGIAFGANEDMFQSYISEGIQAHPEILSEKSASRIWRFAQRAHFHAGGIAAFSLGLIIITALSSLRAGMKTLTSILIGLSGFYPLSWFSMFLLSPSIGTAAAHHHVLNDGCVYAGVGGLLLGVLLLVSNLFFGLFSEHAGWAD